MSQVNRRRKTCFIAQLSFGGSSKAPKREAKEFFPLESGYLIAFSAFFCLLIQTRQKYPNPSSGPKLKPKPTTTFIPKLKPRFPEKTAEQRKQKPKTKTMVWP